ncbi:MAG TPA: PQQ-binding-like beta-propeller repeat protein [Solirubrobacteraceae bacterium]|nr:PQQ-binding-like beta-propeller repeat protein [Solirubrobacteraceae bacterium]
MSKLIPRTKRARLATAGGLVLVLAGIAIGAYVYEHDRTGSIYHPKARFVPTPAPTAPTKPVDDFTWPLYGYTKEHTRFFPAPSTLHPPFKRVWVNNARTLLEFPPVIAGERIYQLGDNGVIRALNKATGHTVWHRSIGHLSASTPAVVGKLLYATVLSRPRGGNGRVWALNTEDGSIDWYRNLPSPSESSPMVDDGKVIFGTQNGTVYALNAVTGNVVWSYHASGAVKASPTLSKGVLYFGDYSGHVQAISERTGRRIWRSGSEGALLGSGTFYSTPAADYGRIFLGNTDGRVYAYDAQTGKLDWAVQTGAYVYSSPAVTNAPGLGPTIYIGSYDGTFRALNARSGRVAWEYNAHGKISGSPTIVGRTVYFADLGTHKTYGLGISTGRLSFELDTGSFDPVISDGRLIYLTGLSGLYALAPRAVTPASTTARKSPPRQAHATARKSHAHAARRHARHRAGSTHRRRARHSRHHS